MICAAHPGEPFLGACTRCGTFVCRLDSAVRDERLYCQTCAAHREVAYVEAFRERLLGRRFVLNYVIGGAGVILVASGGVIFALLRRTEMPVGILATLLGALQLPFFLGARGARPALMATGLLGGAVVVVEAGLRSDWSNAGGGAVIGFLGVFIAGAGYAETQMRLFFRDPVPDEKVRALWDRTRGNRLAERGLSLSLLALFVPGLALVSLLVSREGLRRVDPKAQPPIGNRGHAVAGIVCSLVGVVSSTVLAVVLFQWITRVS